jgi:hypothetical protein
MFLSKRLRCSFCGKSDSEVAKLVAGPRVYICDVCAAEVHRIMNDPTIGMAQPLQRNANAWRRVVEWFRQRFELMRGCRWDSMFPG